MVLEVDIEKRLESYPLRVKFTADDNPLSVLGASGAGKSMTLRCIAGLERPERGRIVLNGRVLFDSAQKVNLPSRERRVGIVFQKYALLPNLTVAQNIEFGLGRFSREDRNARIKKHIAEAHLGGLENRLPAQISGGEQQRAALARALATEPDALLLDEPLSALDAYLRPQVERQLIETLGARRGAALFVTHNIDEAYRIGTEMLVMSRGSGIAFGPKQQLFERPPSLAVAQLTGCKNLSTSNSVAAGLVEATDWQCRLSIASGLERGRHIGIRAHHLVLAKNETSANAPNTFPCWVVTTSETPFRVTVYLQLNSAPKPGGTHHLQAEIYREKYEQIKNHPTPWRVTLPKDKLFTVPD